MHEGIPDEHPERPYDQTSERPALTIQEFGENTDGSAVLVLHAGSGPRTITGFSATLSAFAKEAHSASVTSPRATRPFYQGTT
jgi:hypothetical protein